MSNVIRLFSKINLVECNGFSLILKMPYYAVAKGRKIGIYNTWPECETQVKGFAGAKFKKFPTEQEAKNFVSSNSGNEFTRKNSSRTKNKSGILQSKSTFSTSSNQNKQDKDPIEIIDLNDSDDTFDRNDDDALNKIMDNFDHDGNEKRSGNSLTKRKRTIMLDSLPENNTSQSNRYESYPKNKKLKTETFSVGAASCDFIVDDSGFVEVFTDGSCTKNGTVKAKAGLGIYFGEDHPLNLSEPVSGRATNNCGEIQAATKAIKIAHSMGIKKLAVKTDSKFLINSITKWISGWKRKGWKLASGEPVKNEIDFKELDEAVKLLNVKWIYVEAHKGILGNERADQLAKEGAARYNLK